jgi:hypothetical protein
MNWGICGNENEERILSKTVNEDENVEHFRWWKM